MFSYLTGKQISKACHEAQQHGDYRLSLLLSQVTGNTFTRNLLYKQLADWQEMKVGTGRLTKKKKKTRRAFRTFKRAVQLNSMF